MSRTEQFQYADPNYTHNNEFSFPPFYFEYFERTATWDTRYDAYRRALHKPSIPTLCLLAKTAIELSVTANNELVADDLQAEASGHIQVLEEVDQPDIAIETAVLKHNLPLQVSLHRHHEHPNPSQLTDAYEGVVHALSQTTDTFYNENDPIYTYYKGVATESAALVMLQRYGAQVIQSGDWTPVPALISQERGIYRSNNWDISVITDAEKPFTPASKIQVKWGNFDHHSYSDDISVVAVKKDLCVYTESTGTDFTVSRFINEAIFYRPGASFERVYNKRVEQLLDKIDDAA